MRLLLGLLFLIVLVAGCKKDKTPTPEPTPAPTKWELIPGHYKVYDSTGVFIYEMDIEYSSGTSSLGYHIDSLTFINFDDNFNFHVAQTAASNNKNNVFIGIHEGVSDSINNHWTIFDLGSDEHFNSFRNDTIVFYFQKQNMPYWWNDGTQYFNENLKHIAVKQ
jgi:hypothetical protein